ncbi:MAG TPA: DUF488 domain-containing protein [Thermoanaerobaculia bacterium]|nr:DUF488 domain-containing protein [Thermoanaerobaculia bacterium]
MSAIYTLGHSTRPLAEFLALLDENGIRLLTDVRRYPASRRHPQFSRPALEASLQAAGIDYVHEPDLGGRRATRPDSPNTAWRVAAFRGYADHMNTPEFQSALARLIARGVGAAARPTAILCAEAVPWRCHRRLIADALVARDVPVLHILGPGRLDPHALHPDARVLPDGNLVYPAGGSEQGRIEF